MRTFIYLFFLVGMSALYGQPDFGETTVSGLQKSKLVITGKTTVNSFTCSFDSAYLKDTQRISYCHQGDVIVLRNAVLSLEIEGFNCGGKAINKDFRAMLKADNYPNITLNFKKVTFTESGAETTVAIDLAGILHNYLIPVTFTEGTLNHAKGVLKLNISDYDLKVPSKMFGLITVKDAIEINFDIAALLDTEH